MLEGSKLFRYLFFSTITTMVITLFVSTAHAEVLEEIISWETLSRDEVEELVIKTKLSEREEVSRGLIYAKAFILQGDLESAEFLLRKIVSPQNQLNLVKMRYQATVEFLKGNYKETLEFLDHSFFQLPEYYREICLLRVLSMMRSGSSEKLAKEINSCNGAALTYSPTSGLWLSGLDLVLKGDYSRFPGTRGNDALDIATDNDSFRAWAKLALYSNLEDVVLARIADYPYTVFNSKTNREILGFLYYRTGNFSEATRLTEDLDGPNVENIRGNLALRKQAYELAFGHFQLALKKKGNSLNALQRALPLSWTLGRYADGLDLIDKISFSNLEQNKRLFLKAAFNYASGSRDLAQKIVDVLKSNSNESMPLELQLLDFSTAIHAKDKRTIRNVTLRACRKYDGISCWGQLSHYYWDDLSLVSKRNEPVIAEEAVKASVAFLTDSSAITPLEEKVYIDQKDIEELDGSYLDEIIKKRELD